MGDIPASQVEGYVSIADATTGNAVTVLDKGDGTYALKTESVALDFPIPAGKTFLKQYVSTTISAGDTDTDYVVPNGETWHISRFGWGARFPGSAALIFDPAGTNEEVHKLHSESNNFESTINRDFVGNGVKIIRIRRNSLVGNNISTVYFSGYK